ncbi:pyridoxal-phosphate dependent enzyme [Aquimarina sp. Aq78]|uniref:pyridoxal-phosphate dependent enzyme n=1 Tax=Aquimarina sp. Aq78 TaxID=1191889 RepID=UPI000D0F59D1|nr:pyridoxal-phosphate dependent enzyme [Aquimarina sp. Aq78]
MIMKLIEKLSKIEKFIGNTKTYQLDYKRSNLFAKLEYGSFMGSIKDRLAFYTVRKAILDGYINEDTTVIESSSGNFAVGLAGICKCLGLKFVAVVDPNITEEKEKHLSFLAHKTIKVHKRDQYDSYLLTRIKLINTILEENGNYFNINQYKNINNYLCYYNTMANEIIRDFKRLDYLFIAVSTGGTVTGLSLKLKEHYPNIKIVAVDIEGSIIFSNEVKKRSISGMGASRKSNFIEKGKLDEAIILPQNEIMQGCFDLLKEQMVFAGGSSGAVYVAAKKLLEKENNPDLNALIICPDRGHAYIDSIYKKVDNKVLEKLPKSQLEYGSLV